MEFKFFFGKRLVMTNNSLSFNSDQIKICKFLFGPGFVGNRCCWTKKKVLQKTAALKYSILSFLKPNNKRQTNFLQKNKVAFKNMAGRCFTGHTSFFVVAYESVTLEYSFTFAVFKSKPTLFQFSAQIQTKVLP